MIETTNEQQIEFANYV